MSLPDYLAADLDIVFIGFNAGLKSGRVGHYYAGPGNLFWPFLYEAGFTDRLLTYEEDANVLDYGIGLTDLAKRSTRAAADLSTDELRRGLRVVERKLEPIQPGIIAFNGKSGYAAAVGRRCDYGLQNERLVGRPLFLCPSTSGALPMKREEKLHHYVELKDLLGRLNPT